MPAELECETCESNNCIAEGNTIPRSTLQTYGTKAVGLTFNPSNDIQVDRIKRLYAEIIDELDQSRTAKTGEAVRLLSIAITEAQTAQMWAVKAVTWKN